MANPEPDQNEKLPEPLTAALRKQAFAPVLVPRDREALIVATARRQLRRQIARHGWGKRLIWAAAALVIAGLIVWSFVGSPRSKPNSNMASTGRNPADLDGDGRVDIFDAFLLARAIRDGRTATAWDVNRDGVVDGRDVALVAHRAVQLDRGKAP
jgi:hypothetical protein